MRQLALFFVSIVLCFSSAFVLCAERILCRLVPYGIRNTGLNSLTGSLRWPRPLLGLNRSFAATSSGGPPMAA
jgi:hypothetical protein